MHPSPRPSIQCPKFLDGSWESRLCDAQRGDLDLRRQTEHIPAGRERVGSASQPSQGGQRAGAFRPTQGAMQPTRSSWRRGREVADVCMTTVHTPRPSGREPGKRSKIRVRIAIKPEDRTAVGLCKSRSLWCGTVYARGGATSHSTTPGRRCSRWVGDCNTVKKSAHGSHSCLRRHASRRVADCGRPVIGWQNQERQCSLEWGAIVLRGGNCQVIAR